MSHLLKFLSWKKWVIATILCIVITWCLWADYISENTALALQSLVMVLTGGASMATRSYFTSIKPKK